MSDSSFEVGAVRAEASGAGTDSVIWWRVAGRAVLAGVVAALLVGCVGGAVVSIVGAWRFQAGAGDPHGMFAVVVGNPRLVAPLAAAAGVMETIGTLIGAVVRHRRPGGRSPLWSLLGLAAFGPLAATPYWLIGSSTADAVAERMIRWLTDMDAQNYERYLRIFQQPDGIGWGFAGAVCMAAAAALALAFGAYRLPMPPSRADLRRVVAYAVASTALLTVVYAVFAVQEYRDLMGFVTSISG